jgi:putative tricarboxylic transport membrane protein
MSRRGLSDRLAGAAAVAVALWYGWTAQSFVQGFGDPAGPAVFPTVVAVPMGVLGLVLVLRPDPDPSWGRGPVLLRQGLSLATLLAYPALLQLTGFPIATALAGAAVARVLNARWPAALTTGAVLGVGLYLLFVYGLGLMLPLGPRLG